jgi:uncharacterized protein with GYD domain
MPYYLVQVAYTAEGAAKLVKNPQNRIESVGRAVESFGGSVEGGWFSFGEYDAILIASMPDNVAAAAFSMAVAAGGAVRACKTTPLLTAEEAVEAMRKAGGGGYQPPSG